MRGTHVVDRIGFKLAVMVAVLSLLLAGCGSDSDQEIIRTGAGPGGQQANFNLQIGPQAPRVANLKINGRNLLPGINPDATQIEFSCERSSDTFFLTGRFNVGGQSVLVNSFDDGFTSDDADEVSTFLRIPENSQGCDITGQLPEGACLVSFKDDQNNILNLLSFDIGNSPIVLTNPDFASVPRGVSLSQLAQNSSFFPSSIVVNSNSSVIQPARVFYSDTNTSSLDVTSGVFFRSDNPALATLSNNPASRGNFSAISVGNTVIRGFFGGSQMTNSLPVSVTSLGGGGVTPVRLDTLLGPSLRAPFDCLKRYPIYVFNSDTTSRELSFSECTLSSSNPSVCDWVNVDNNIYIQFKSPVEGSKATLSFSAPGGSGEVTCVTSNTLCSVVGNSQILFQGRNLTSGTLSLQQQIAETNCSQIAEFDRTGNFFYLGTSSTGSINTCDSVVSYLWDGSSFVRTGSFSLPQPCTSLSSRYWYANGVRSSYLECTADNSVLITCSNDLATGAPTSVVQTTNLPGVGNGVCVPPDNTPPVMLSTFQSFANVSVVSHSLSSSSGLVVSSQSVLSQLEGPTTCAISERFGPTQCYFGDSTTLRSFITSNGVDYLPLSGNGLLGPHSEIRVLNGVVACSFESPTSSQVYCQIGTLDGLSALTGPFNVGNNRVFLSVFGGAPGESYVDYCTQGQSNYLSNLVTSDMNTTSINLMNQTQTNLGGPCTRVISLYRE